MSHDLHIRDGVLLSYTGRAESVTVPDQVHTIGEGAFKACVSLKQVILPEGLCRILPHAFKGCRRLTDIRIPQGVSCIGSYAFHRCHALEVLSLPPSVKELGDCVFLYCDSLTQVSIPGVRRLGKQAFLNDVRLTWLEISPDLEEDCICDVFTGCSRISRIAFPDGPEYHFSNAVEALNGGITLPALVRTIAVDILRTMELDGRRLVRFLTNLKHVDIPEGIRCIGKSCFFDKRGILSVTLPASLREIEGRAFRNCIGLASVRFLSDQVQIHEDAFLNCTALTQVVTPDGACHRIQGISRPAGEEIPPLVRTVHRQVLGNFRLSGTVLFKYLGDESRVVVPEGVTVIAEEAFAGNESIDRVLLPESVTEIGAGAFRDCLVLQSIHGYGHPADQEKAVQFPAGIRRIGAGAFENCVKLLRIRLPGSLVQVEDRAFKHCHKLKEVLLEPGLRSLGEQAFYGCRSLKEISFPDSLVSLGDMAFYRCSGLGTLCLPPALDHVGNLAFAQSGVRRVRIQGTGCGYGNGLFFGCLSLGTVILESGVRHIPDRLAYGCKALKQVVLPDTLESVGRSVWEDTPFLEEHPLSGDIFWDGRNLSGDVRLPEETRIVAGGAFYGNLALTSVRFPDSATWIGPAALKGCCRLGQVTWPRAVTRAQEEVFSGCTSLETVTGSGTSAPVPWRHIGQRAFFGCRCLEHVALSQVQVVEKEGFSGCTRLVPDHPDALVRVGEQAFAGTGACGDRSSREPVVLGSILVSGLCLEGEVRVPEGVTAIAPYAFGGNRNLTGLWLPDSLTHIGEGAFWGCTGLAHVRFPATCCTLEDRAFEKCPSLSRIRLHTDQAGVSAFACCTGLEHVELTGLKVLESRLFAHCTSLRQCICPGVSVIRGNCFEGCGNLEAFDFSSVREIGSYGFQDCDRLRSISLWDHTLVHSHGFEDCGGLETLCLSGSQGILTLREYALSGCTALACVRYQGQAWKPETYRDMLSERMPRTVRMVFASAFSCFAIDREEILRGYRGAGRLLRIPEGIRRIEAQVFQDVLMLRQVTIPGTVEYIGARAFSGTAWLEARRRVSPLVTVGHMLLDGSCCTGEVTVPEHIRLVCGWAFAGGTGIRRIRFLSERVRVEAYAFRNCIGLKELVLGDGSQVVFRGIEDRRRELPPLARQAAMDSLNCFKTDQDNRLVECTGNIPRLVVAEGITAIGDQVFEDGNLLTCITLPTTVTSIGRAAFAGCKWLTRVDQAWSVTSIGERAFSGCGVLQTIQLSKELCRLGARAFENCTCLEEILLPEGLEEIPDRTFFRCHSLRKVVLPSTLRRIGREAFAFCRNLDMPQVPENTLVEERAFEGVCHVLP